MFLSADQRFVCLFLKFFVNYSFSNDYNLLFVIVLEKPRRATPEQIYSCTYPNFLHIFNY